MMNSDTSLDKRFAYVYKDGGRPIREASQMLPGKAIQWTSTDDPETLARRRRDCAWASNYEGHIDGHKKELQLIAHLRAFGGDEVCMPELFEEDVCEILERGQLWYGDHSRMVKGRPSDCHRNSCVLWEKNKAEKEIAIATGYALSKDGLWRQHSWLVLRNLRSVEVIETTVKRIAYFGFVMTHDEADEFCRNNF